MAKKGQGISINVIVIAAIALLILVIMSVLVIRSGRQINDNTQLCENTEGGKCISEEDFRIDGCGDDYFRDSAKGCKDGFDGSPQVCCRKL